MFKIEVLRLLVDLYKLSYNLTNLEALNSVRPSPSPSEDYLGLLSRL